MPRVILAGTLSLTFLLSEICEPTGYAAADEIKAVTLSVSPDEDVNPEAAPTVVSPAQPPAGTTPSPTPPGEPGPPGSASAAKPESPAAENSVKRPPADKYVPQPIDLEIRKNPEGKVSFSLVGQRWESVLQWLSDASALSLDWQELPGDSLNLITTREYTMEEARDLINRHLLSRGFTMIVSGEVMSIVKLKDMNPAMVKRVTPDQLAELPDHTICKVSFNLDWLIADEAVEELKPMLSSAGQIHKLSRTNRIEVIDTAVSLRQIWELIESEQSDEGDEQLVRSFRLEHRRADDVIRMLRELLKLQDAGGTPEGGMSMDPNMIMQQMQQMQAQMQQAAQQAAAQPGVAGAAGTRAKVETRLVLNQRENMILAQAAPDQMEVIEKAIEQIDVPADSGRTLLQNINRMKVYRLESVDPQTLADLLQQLGDMDPATILKVDKEKRSIIAWATLSDHLTITTLVEKLDQSSRKIEVIPLRRLDAEYVAGTIRLLMGKEEEKEQSPFSRYGYIDFGMMGQQQTKKEPTFRVEADTDNNRLLVNANAIEMAEIQDLLVKLGELPDPNAANDTFRVFDLNPDEDMELFREQLERYWRRGNRLEFDLPDPPSEPSTDAREKRDESEDAPNLMKSSPTAAATGSGSSSKPRVRVWPMRSEKKRNSPGSALDELLAAHKSAATNPVADPSTVLTRLSDEQSEVTLESTVATEEKSESAESRGAELATEPPAQDQVEPSISRELIEKLRRQLETEPQESDEAPPDFGNSGNQQKHSTDGTTPVRISMAPDGKLIVSSTDPVALAEIEQLISQVASPRRSFKVFRLKYATPSWVTLNLKDFFKAEEETKSTLEYDPYFGIMPSQKKVKGNSSLSKRRQPQFISDNFTSTILVRDADAKQLRTIEDLIAIYDIPEPSDSRSMRVTTIFRLEHAKASSVAAAVKDVFRDLLSSNDKALEKDDKNQQRQGSGGLVTFLPGAPKTDGADEEEPIRFKGLLSIGIDESSNTLIVSSAGTLMDTIGEMIEALDKAADSSSVVQVIKVDRTVDLLLIQQRLQELMKTMQPPPGQQPGQPVPGQPVVPGVQPGVEGAQVVPDGM